ncbi:GRIP and coiled-coil domain-containing protein 2-like isoform X2 [Trichogramma pretiosum]|uniref:GRIP and coiled-coil domain-containing protein 2-like isoform X2 n=1 Tax=Trichogramma pretiosum TaxID=7493 RepID=UPI000C71B712|nr:GRIP and coiled-coil domain-containing protein 2-like isoform X2 [Trichogramma pretiosum]
MDQLYKYNGITLRRMNRVQFKEHYFQRKQKRSQAFDDQRFLMACDDSFNEEQPENAEKKLHSNIKCRGKTRIPVRCVFKTCDGARRILTCVTEEKPKPFVVGKVRHKIHSPPFLHNPLKTSEAQTPYLPMTYQSVIPENYKFTAPKGLAHFKYTTPKTSENSPFTLKSLLLPRIKRFTNSPLEQEHTERSLHKVKRELWTDEEPPIFGRTNVAKALEKEYNKDLDSQDGVAIVPSTSNSVQKVCTNSKIDSEKIEISVSLSFEVEKDESFVDRANISSNDVRKTKKATQYSSQMDELQTSLKYLDADADREAEKENGVEAIEKSINRLNELKSSKQISESCVPTRYQSHIPVKHHGSISMHEGITKIQKISSSSTENTKKDTSHPSQLNQSLNHASSKNYERETDSDEEIENEAKTVEQSDYLLYELKTVKPTSERSEPLKVQPNTKVSHKGSPLMQKTVSESPKRLLNKSLKIKIATPHPSQLNKSSAHLSSKNFERETDSNEEIENQAKTVQHSDCRHHGSISIHEGITKIQKMSSSSTVNSKKDTSHPSQLNQSLNHASSKNFERETDSDEEIENQAKTVEQNENMLDELKTDEPTSESSESLKLQSNTNVCDKVSRHHLISIETKKDSPHPSQLNKSSAHASSKIFERETDSDEEIENQAKTVEQSDYLLDELETDKSISVSSVPTKEQSNTKVSHKGSLSLHEGFAKIQKISSSSTLKTKKDTPHSSELNESSAHLSSKNFERETDSYEEIENQAKTVEQSEYMLDELKTDEPTPESSEPLKQQSNTNVCDKNFERETDSNEEIENQVETDEQSDYLLDELKTVKPTSERSEPSKLQPNTKVSHKGSPFMQKIVSESPKRLLNKSLKIKIATPHPSQLNKSSAHLSSKNFEKETDSNEEIESHAETVEHCDFPLDASKTDKSISKNTVPTKEQPNTKVSHNGSPLMQKTVSESPKRLLNKSLKIKIATPHPSQLNKSSAHVSSENFERESDSDEEIENQAKTVQHSDCRHHVSISMHEGDTKIQTTSRNSVLETKTDSPRPSQLNNSLISYIKSKIWGLVTDSEAEIENQIEDRVEQSVMNESTTGKLIAESLVPSNKQSNTKVSHDGSISTLGRIPTDIRLSHSQRTKDDSIHPLRLNKSLGDPSSKNSEKFQVRQAEVKNHVFTDEHCVPSSNVLTTNKATIENLILSNKESNTNICNKPLVSMSEGIPIIRNTSECMMHSNKQLNHKITGQDPITFSEGVSTFPKIIIECTRSPERIAKKIEKLCDGLDECPITVLKKPSEKIMKTEVIDLVSDEEEEDSYKTFIQRVLNNCAKHQRLSNACATSPLLNSKTNISPVETPKVVRRKKREASANSSLVASHLTAKTNVSPVETPKVGRREKKEASANFSSSALPHTPKINISPAKTPKVGRRKKKEASENSSLRPSLVTPQTNISPVKTPKVGRRKKKEASENSSLGPFLLTPQTNISPVKTPKVVGRKKKEASENSSLGTSLLIPQTNISPVKTPKVVGRKKKEASENSSLGPSLLTPEINISPAKTPKVVGRKKKEALANSSPGPSLLTPVRVLNLRSRNVEVSPSPSKSTPRRRRKKDEVRV